MGYSTRGFLSRIKAGLGIKKVDKKVINARKGSNPYSPKSNLKTTKTTKKLIKGKWEYIGPVIPKKRAERARKAKKSIKRKSISKQYGSMGVNLKPKKKKSLRQKRRDRIEGGVTASYRKLKTLKVLR